MRGPLGALRHPAFHRFHLLHRGSFLLFEGRHFIIPVFRQQPGDNFACFWFSRNDPSGATLQSFQCGGSRRQCEASLGFIRPVALETVFGKKWLNLFCKIDSGLQLEKKTGEKEEAQEQQAHITFEGYTKADPQAGQLLVAAEVLGGGGMLRQANGCGECLKVGGSLDVVSVDEKIGDENPGWTGAGDVVKERCASLESFAQESN